MVEQILQDKTLFNAQHPTLSNMLIFYYLVIYM